MLGFFRLIICGAEGASREVSGGLLRCQYDDHHAITGYKSYVNYDGGHVFIILSVTQVMYNSAGLDLDNRKI